MMILLDPNTGLSVDPLAISPMRFHESRGDRYLEIVMKAAYSIQVQHSDGNGESSIDIYQLHRQILEAA